MSENIAVPLNLSISDVKEPEKRKRSYSKSIKLEGTSNNMAFFLSAYSLSMDVENSSNVSFDPAIRNPCEFYKNDLLIFKGKLKLNEVIIQDKNYYFDCTLFSDVVDIFAKLKEKKLNEEHESIYNYISKNLNKDYLIIDLYAISGSIEIIQVNLDSSKSLSISTISFSTLSIKVCKSTFPFLIEIKYLAFGLRTIIPLPSAISRDI